jgi:hypothetical protein
MSGGENAPPTAMVGPDGSSARPLTPQEADPLPSGTGMQAEPRPTPAPPPMDPAGGVVP